MGKNPIKLAIVIPFYKINYFRDLLTALVSQTDSRFNVYIGNDSSPDHVDELIAEYEMLLSIEYAQFTERLGHASLAQQWMRCIAQFQVSEEWVWVLPDDDCPSINCVHEFYQAVGYAEKNNIKAFRFPIDLIDSNGSILSKNKELNPDLETGARYFERAMKGEISTSLGDIIFNRKALSDSGGFVDFTQAWGSDQATVIRTTHGSKIKILRAARLGFRMSGANISSQKNDGLRKIHARLEFAKWLKRNEHLLLGTDLASVYRNFAMKQDYYFVEVWDFHMELVWCLYKLRIICTREYNPLPIIRLLWLRLFRTQVR